MSHRRFPPRPHPTSIRISALNKRRLEKHADKRDTLPTTLIQWIINDWLDKQDMPLGANLVDPDRPLPRY